MYIFANMKRSTMFNWFIHCLRKPLTMKENTLIWSSHLRCLFLWRFNYRFSMSQKNCKITIHVSVKIRPTVNWILYFFQQTIAKDICVWIFLFCLVFFHTHIVRRWIKTCGAVIKSSCDHVEVDEVKRVQ